MANLEGQPVPAEDKKESVEFKVPEEDVGANQQAEINVGHDIHEQMLELQGIADNPSELSMAALERAYITARDLAKELVKNPEAMQKLREQGRLEQLGTLQNKLLTAWQSAMDKETNQVAAARGAVSEAYEEVPLDDSSISREDDAEKQPRYTTPQPRKKWYQKFFGL